MQSIEPAQLVESYEGILLDAYGVLLTGNGPLPGALRFVEALHRRDKPFLIVTNDASRLPASIAARLQSFGFPVQSEHVLSSGKMLVQHYQQRHLVGAKTVVLGPPEAHLQASQAGAVLIQPGPYAAAEVLVVADEAGFDFLPTMDACLTMLCHRLDAGCPVEMILPNPDLIYPVGHDQFGLASGSMALILEAALELRYGQCAPRFARLGKPFRPIFATAKCYMGTESLVMVGDQLPTDIKGANDAGLDSVLVGTGLTNLSRVHALLPQNAAPTFLMPALDWPKEPAPPWH